MHLTRVLCPVHVGMIFGYVKEVRSPQVLGGGGGVAPTPPRGVQISPLGFASGICAPPQGGYVPYPPRGPK
jgi:hypothetical protein